MDGEVGMEKLIEVKNLTKMFSIGTLLVKTKIAAVFKTQESGSMKVEELIKLLRKKGFETDYFTVMKIDALDKDMKPILQ